MPILSGLGYVFMGCGALMLMIGYFVAIAQEKGNTVLVLAGAPVFLMGAGFTLLARGIAILRLV